jgi:ferredoxin
LIILALLFAGNLFCAACPFTLPRTVARRLSQHGKRWPQILRNKWISVIVLLLFFWLYEWLDLWASPWLTAWLVIVYFVLSFALEAFFSESPFCKYVCPLGAFNFVYSMASPLQIQARDRQICRTCPGKECINGSESTLGCGTLLFVPMIDSNMDCTVCLDCVRACPYDNVALTSRPILRELVEPTRQAPRWDQSFLVIGLTFFGILNAFGMVPPVYALQARLAEWGIKTEGLRLLLVFVVGNLGLTAVTTFGLASLSAWKTGIKASTIAARFSKAFVPLGLGIWFAHYGFHFSIGGLTIVPAMQSFFLDHRIGIFGAIPRWDLSYILPVSWIFPLQILALFIGFIMALSVLGRQALQLERSPMAALRMLLPWASMILIVILISLSIFNLPMEMRGAFPGGT